MNESLEELEGLLKEVGDKLNKSAYIVRQLNFEEQLNLKRIGLALGKIYDVQNEIYSVKPELRPEYLK